MRTDEYLVLHELKEEEDKLVEAAGKDMADNALHSAATSIVNSACKGATNLHASTPLVNKIAVHRNELRMLKRGDEKRVISKKKYSGVFGFAAQVATNTMNLGRNAVEGVLRLEVDVTAMTNAYGRISD